MSDTFKTCRKCGKMIGKIETEPWRIQLVDADPVEVYPDPTGDIYLRIDGSKMRGRTDDRWSKGTVKAEMVWRPHRCNEV